MAKVIVIDDEEDVVFLMKRILEKAGYTVISANDGEEGLKKIKEEKPDLVILDLMMPGIDGYEVLQRIRADPEISRIPVIIVSVKGNEEDIVKGINLGANDYFTKPFNEKILLTKIKSILKLRKLEKDLEKAHKKLKEEHKSLEEEYERLKEELTKIKFKKPEKKEKEGITDILGEFSLIEYNPKENFEDLIISLVNDYIARGRNVILVSSQPRTNVFYKNLEDEVGEGICKLVNMPRARTEFRKIRKGMIEIPMTSLEYFGAIIDELPEDSVIIFTPLSKLIKNLDEKSVYHFLVKMIDLLAEKNITFIAMVNEDAHTKGEIAGLEELFMNIAKVEDGKLVKIK